MMPEEIMVGIGHAHHITAGPVTNLDKEAADLLIEKIKELNSLIRKCRSHGLLLNLYINNHELKCAQVVKDFC